MNYVAIDLGAESGRVILGQVEGEKIALEEIHRFPNTPIRQGTSIHWDLAALLYNILDGFSGVNKLGKPIHSVSADSWGVDYVLLNPPESAERWKTPVFHYRDPRTTRGLDTFLKKVPWEKIFAETGIQFMQINTLFQLAWEDPKRLEGADRILSVADYVNHHFGGCACIEESMASTFQLYNPRTRDWSALLLEKLGIPKSLFGEAVRPGTTLGNFNERIFKNLADAKIVATCSHDTGAAVAAVPAAGVKWAYLSSGTWSLMGVERTEPIINDKARGLNFTNEIGYNSTIRLLKNISGLWLLQECRRAWAEAGHNFDYTELTRLAQSETGPGALIDPMDPRFLAPPNMPDAIASYCHEHNQPAPESPAQFTRCIFESLAQLYAKTLHQVEDLTSGKIERLHIVGGGSKNAFLNQLTANACQIPVLAGPVEATALGNIMIQSITAGEVPDLPTARALIQKNFPITTFTPQRAA